MKLSLLGLFGAIGPLASASLSWRLVQAPRPTADESDAYARITKAMDLAVARYNNLTTLATKVITVEYNPGVQTADGNFNGNIRFGRDRAYMTERTALHESAHTLGVGQRRAFDDHCASGNWPTALPLMKSFDGPDAKISCGGGHFWNYGLNYENEMSEINAIRHCLMVDALLADGMAAY